MTEKEKKKIENAIGTIIVMGTERIHYTCTRIENFIYIQYEQYCNLEASLKLKLKSWQKAKT